MNNRNIKMTAKVSKSNAPADGYIIVKFINGNPQAYNYINNNFSDFELSNFDATVFKDKQKALNFVEYLCDEDRNHPVFLSAIKVTD